MPIYSTPSEVIMERIVPVKYRQWIRFALHYYNTETNKCHVDNLALRVVRSSHHFYWAAGILWDGLSGRNLYPNSQDKHATGHRAAPILNGLFKDSVFQWITQEFANIFLLILNICCGKWDNLERHGTDCQCLVISSWSFPCIKPA